MTSIEPVPQPRMDTLVKDSALNVEWRRVEYSGTLWLGGRPQVTPGMIISNGQWIKELPPFFLPDSLPYKSGAVGDGVVAATVAIQSAPEHVTVTGVHAAFGADPGAPDRSWMQLVIAATGRGPLGLSYRVVAITKRDAVEDA